MQLSFRSAISIAQQKIRIFFAEDAGAKNVAAFRIGLFLSLAVYVAAQAKGFLFLSTVPAELRFYDQSIPVGRTGTVVELVLLAVACVCGLLNKGARWAALLAAIVAFALFPSLRWFTQAYHNHLFIFVLLLFAAAPKSIRPARVVILLLGILYLRSGLVKLTSTGLSWCSPSNVQAIFHRRWFFTESWDFWSQFPIPPALWGFLGAMAILGELAFFPLALSRRTRTFACVLAAGFHCAVSVTLGIHLLWLVVLLFGLIEWFPRESVQSTRTTSRAFTVLASIALAAQLGAAISSHRPWPLGVLPAFAYRTPPTASDWQFESAGTDRQFTPLSDAPLRAQFASPTGWTELYDRLHIYKALGHEAAETNLWRHLQAEHLVPPGVRTVRVFRREYSVVPVPTLLRRVQTAQIDLAP